MNEAGQGQEPAGVDPQAGQAAQTATQPAPANATSATPTPNRTAPESVQLSAVSSQPRAESRELNAAAAVYDAAYVTALRTEAADYRVKNKELSTAMEAATQKTTQLESQLRTLSLQTAISTAETRVADAEVALKLIDQTKLKFDGQGRPENLNDLLKELVAQKPYLAAGPAVQPTPASNPARGGAKFTIEQVKAMSPAEINANWDAVQEVLRGS